MFSNDEKFYDVNQSDESTTEDEDEFLNSLESESITSEKMDTEEFQYDVLSTEQIVNHMIECIREVNTIVQIPLTVTRILLNHFKWDKQKLYDRYYGGDQESLFEEAGIINPYKKPLNSLNITEADGQTKDCEICTRNFPLEEMTSMACGHRFCSDCWNEYLTSKIMDQGMCQIITCAAHDCEILIDDETVMSLIANPKVKLKYQQLITNSFVECNRLMKWCPQPDCDYAIVVQYVNAKPVTCKCHYTFCFACGERWHDPVKCDLLKRWLQDRSTEIHSLRWISNNTKECPKCHVAIQKTGGCNFMICTNRSCRYSFCWLCLQQLASAQHWRRRFWHFCNSYDEPRNKLLITTQKKSKSNDALKRSKFFYTRYQTHLQSLKFEYLLYDSVKGKMEEMMQQQLSWIEVQFLKTAVDTLCKCRQTLMYSYVFAYYSGRGNQFSIFQANQRDLERATELLSEYLEREITKENVLDVLQKVQDKYKYCESRCKALLDHVHEGYEEGWWDYIPPVETQPASVLQRIVQRLYNWFYF